MISLPLGELPKLSFFIIHAKLSPTDARDALDVMRRSLHRFGPSNTLRAMLAAYGFEWSQDDGALDAELQDAVDGVAAALGSESES